MSRSLLLVLAVSLGMGGCTAPPDQPPPAVPPVLEAPAPVNNGIPMPPPPKPPPPKPPAPKPLPKPANGPDELIGLDQDAVSKLLGDPADVSTEGGARILTFRSQECVLDVIFFLDVKTGVDRVLSFDLPSSASRRGRPCYAELRRER
jgi:hypothetical protein